MLHAPPFAYHAQHSAVRAQGRSQLTPMPQYAKPLVRSGQPATYCKAELRLGMAGTSMQQGGVGLKNVNESYR